MTSQKRTRAPLFHLIYVSSATRALSEADLLFLLEQSRRRNERQHVTGMLLYAGGNFFQVLEGEKKDVEEIYEAIVSDDRNSGNIVIEEAEIGERTFPGWSMGFRHLHRQDKHEIKGYTDFLEREMAPTEFANKSDVVVDMLYEFRKND